MENKLKELRAASGLTQEDLADRIGVSRQTVISLESGRYSPSLPLAFRIAKCFDLSIEEVFVYDGS